MEWILNNIQAVLIFTGGGKKKGTGRNAAFCPLKDQDAITFSME
jgi:hypothetical protein